MRRQQTRTHIHTRRQLVKLLSLLKKYVVFLTGGTLGYLILNITHYLLKKNLDTFISYAIGLLIADLFTFAYHTLITFKKKDNIKVRFLHFSITILIISGLNWIIFSLLLIWSNMLELAIPDYLISLFVTGFLSIFNFLINHYLVFRSSTKKHSP